MNNHLSGQPITYRIFYFFNLVLLAAICLTIMFPILLMLSTSITDEAEIAKKGLSLIPSGINLNAYKVAFSDHLIRGAFVNSIAVTVIGTFLSLIVTSMLAYPLSKKFLPYSRFISFIIYFTVLFNGGLIPTYLLIKNIGLINNFWVMIFPGLITPWFMILLRNFFSSLPEELEESARIDGCSEYGILFKIVLPLSLPALATIWLFYAVSYWNNWFGPMLYINRKSGWPLQVILRQMIVAAESMGNEAASGLDSSFVAPKESLKMAVTVIAVAPIMALYPFLQKYFAKGLLIGAVKG